MIIKYFEYYKNFIIFLFCIFIVFSFNLFSHFVKYKQLKYEEIGQTKAVILSIYKKPSFYVLKLKSQDYEFFTNIQELENLKKLDEVNIIFVSTRINFLRFLKGFYTKTIFIEKLEKNKSFKNTLANKSDSQHYNEMIKELFNALFFAIPISKDLREVCTNYGISHLVALSGFHLAVLTFLVYWILYFPYSFFHTRYFPYRNKRFDILLVVMVVLFFYVIFTGVVPSLLRAFVMMLMGIYLLRYGIKLFSFYNLFLVFLIIIALFPKYIFSLSLWFSIFGVFYIFLFIQYFKNIKSWILQLLFFNFWIYLAMNPMVHYFFSTTTYEQMLSPFITIVFTIFYPLELFLHLINQGSLLDEYLMMFLSYKFEVFEVKTSLWFFIVFMFFSFAAIWDKRAFWVLNILLMGFTLFLYV